MPAPNVDVYALRLRGLDRTRRLTEQNRLKTTARAAAVAYFAAMQDGDAGLAEATRARFVAASNALVIGPCQASERRGGAR